MRTGTTVSEIRGKNSTSSSGVDDHRARRWEIINLFSKALVATSTVIAVVEDYANALYKS